LRRNYSQKPWKYARDLNFIKGGRLLVETKYFQELGEWWERQNKLCMWGGRFKSGDAGHFSLTHDGRA